jgi:hypothetical protein
MATSHKDRINELITALGISKNKFAKALGTSSAVISKITTSDVNYGVEFAERIISTFPSVNPRWLLSGIGEMMLPKGVADSRLDSRLDSRQNKKWENSGDSGKEHKNSSSATLEGELIQNRAETDVQRTQEINALWSTLVHREGLDMTGVHYANFTSILGIYSDRVLAYVAEKVEKQLHATLEEHLDKSIDTQQARAKLRQVVEPLNALQDKILAVDHAIYDMMEHVFKAFPDAMELVKGTVIPVHMMPFTEALSPSQEDKLGDTFRQQLGDKLREGEKQPVEHSEAK